MHHARAMHRACSSAPFVVHVTAQSFVAGSITQSACDVPKFSRQYRVTGNRALPEVVERDRLRHRNRHDEVARILLFCACAR